MKPIDKVAWLHIRDRRVLGVRSRGKDTFFTPGGKREVNETDAQALLREIKEEISVDLVPSTITYLSTFTAQAYGKPKGVMVEIKCYKGDYTGEMSVNSEIEELGWLSTKDIPRLGIPFQLIIKWLKEQDLVD